MICCFVVYLNAFAGQGWWDWATTLVQRVRENVTQEYLPSGDALVASVIGSGFPGSFGFAAWKRVWGDDATSSASSVQLQQLSQQSTTSLQPTQPQPVATAHHFQSAQLPKNQSLPVITMPGVQLAPNLLKLAATANVARRLDLPGQIQQTICEQVSSLVTLQSVLTDASSLKCFYNWAVAEFQGRRPQWEDTHVIRYKHPYLFLGLYDGHGGDLVLRMLVGGNKEWGLNPLHDVILSRVAKAETDIPEVLKKSFLFFDETMHSKNHKLSSGSTAVIALIDMEKRNGYFAWVGDSRGLLIDEYGKVVMHTTDHKPTNTKEYARIKRAGAYVNTQNNRVYNYLNDRTKQIDGSSGLNISRSFGDFKYAKYRKNNKNDVISAEPDVISFDLKNKAYKVLLACDGIFERNMSNQDVADIIMQGEKSDLKLKQYSVEERKKHKYLGGNDETMKMIVKNIVVSAYAKGSRDNMTAIIVDVKR